MTSRGGGFSRPLGRAASDRGRPSAREGPRSSNRRPDPETRSLTVRDTSTCPGARVPRSGRRCARPRRGSQPRPARPRPCGPGTDLEAEGAYGVARGDRASHGTRRTVETSQEAIAGRVDLATLELVRLAPDRCMMPLDETRPVRSPISAVRSVDREMSVNSTVVRTRSGAGPRRTPVRNASISSRIAPAFPAHIR
jgi:hypothetical protein